MLKTLNLGNEMINSNQASYCFSKLWCCSRSPYESLAFM